MRTFDRSVLEQHYEVHKERPFYPNLVDFMSSGPVVAIALEGKDAHHRGPHPRGARPTPERRPPARSAATLA